MSLGATIYRFEIAISDVDRGVYTSIDVRVARHPSEAMRYLLVRVLAYCLLYEEGIAFGKGLSSEEPAISIRDLQGNLRAWIEVGSPTAERLHRAAKASPRVVVFTHHDIALLAKEWRSRPIHRAEHIEVFSLAPAFLDALEHVTDRNTKLELTVTGEQLYATVRSKTLEGMISRHVIAPA